MSLSAMMAHHWPRAIPGKFAADKILTARPVRRHRRACELSPFSWQGGRRGRAKWFAVYARPGRLRKEGAEGTMRLPDSSPQFPPKLLFPRITTMLSGLRSHTSGRGARAVDHTRNL